jgi:DMSO/TMAO reductase YedYZ heme-binding membrane subunit
MSVARVTALPRGRIIWISIALVVIVGVAASSYVPLGQHILAAVQRFMLFYSGVVTLVGLTASVGAGILAADRIVMGPPGRVVSQAVHRAVSLAALAFLVTHIVLEIVAHRSQVIDAFIPFLARGRTFYIGLGTIASDLVIVLIVTGIARGRFAERWSWTWRAIHTTAYLCWPLAIVHGLLAGRTPKPYVDWSYGACLTAVGLILIIRLVATLRGRKETAAHPVPDRVSAPMQPGMPWVPVGPAPAQDLRGYGQRPAMPGGGTARPRALPPGASSGPAATSQPSYPRGTPYLTARPYSPHADRPGRPSGPWYYPPQQPGPEPESSAYPSYPGTEGP